jgi:hypothetical protein
MKTVSPKLIVACHHASGIHSSSPGDSVQSSAFAARRAAQRRRSSRSTAGPDRSAACCSAQPESIACVHAAFRPTPARARASARRSRRRQCQSSARRRRAVRCRQTAATRTYRAMASTQPDLCCQTNTRSRLLRDARRRFRAPTIRRESHPNNARIDACRLSYEYVLDDDKRQRDVSHALQAARRDAVALCNTA